MHITAPSLKKDVIHAVASFGESVHYITRIFSNFMALLTLNDEKPTRSLVIYIDEDIVKELKDTFPTVQEKKLYGLSEDNSTSYYDLMNANEVQFVTASQILSDCNDTIATIDAKLSTSSLSAEAKQQLIFNRNFWEHQANSTTNIMKDSGATTDINARHKELALSHITYKLITEPNVSVICSNFGVKKNATNFHFPPHLDKFIETNNLTVQPGLFYLNSPTDPTDSHRLSKVPKLRIPVTPEVAAALPPSQTSPSGDFFLSAGRSPEKTILNDPNQSALIANYTIEDYRLISLKELRTLVNDGQPEKVKNSSENETHQLKNSTNFKEISVKRTADHNSSFIDQSSRNQTIVPGPLESHCWPNFSPDNTILYRSKHIYVTSPINELETAHKLLESGKTFPGWRKEAMNLNVIREIPPSRLIAQSPTKKSHSSRASNNTATNITANSTSLSNNSTGLRNRFKPVSSNHTSYINPLRKNLRTTMMCPASNNTAHDNISLGYFTGNYTTLHPNTTNSSFTDSLSNNNDSGSPSGGIKFGFLSSFTIGALVVLLDDYCESHGITGVKKSALVYTLKILHAVLTSPYTGDSPQETAVKELAKEVITTLATRYNLPGREYYDSIMEIGCMALELQRGRMEAIPSIVGEITGVAVTQEIVLPLFKNFLRFLENQIGTTPTV